MIPFTGVSSVCGWEGAAPSNAAAAANTAPAPRTAGRFVSLGRELDIVRKIINQAHRSWVIV
jgi:hypothetical protein